MPAQRGGKPPTRTQPRPRRAKLPAQEAAPRFTTDWFSNNLARWEGIVAPHLLSRPGPVLALELGSHEGRSARWLLDNVLSQRAGSHLYVVDRFEDPKVRARFKHNVLDAYPGMVTVLRGEVSRVLRGGSELARLEGRLDFAYVDFAASSRENLEAGVLLFPLLGPRGMLVFDDYTHDRLHGAVCPRRGIDAFLDLYAPLVKVLNLSWQAILIRRERPLGLGVCRSEYYHEDVQRV